jgi:hypothetical protein
MKKTLGKCRAPLFAFLIIGTLGVSVPLSLHGDEETLDRVLREAPKAWNVARKKFSELELSFTYDKYEMKSGSRMTDSYLEGKIRQREDLCFRVDGISHRSNRESVPTAYWIIGNPFYLATLARREQGADSALVVQKLKRRNEDFPGKANNEVFNWHLQRGCYPGFQFGEECLFDCFVNLRDCFYLDRHANLKIVDATSKQDRQGREVVILSLNAVFKSENDLKVMDDVVEMKLLPEKNWALLEFQRKLKGKIAGSPDPDRVLESVYSMTFHYSDEFFFPIKIFEEFKMGTHTTYEESAFGPSVPSSLRCSDCRLPAFGLTEPEDLVPKNDALKYLWVFLGLAAILGIVLYFRKTK